MRMWDYHLSETKVETVVTSFEFKYLTVTAKKQN